VLETDRPEAQIYQLRAVLRGISPLIWRRLLVRSDSTVARLHEVLQIAFGWDDDEHLNRFEIRGREYAVYRDGGGMIGIDARVVRLCDLKLHRLERFVYEYDFGDSWIHELRLETTLPVNPRTIYPMCMAGKRAAPPEDLRGEAHAFMASRGLAVGLPLICVPRVSVGNAENYRVCRSQPADFAQVPVRQKRPLLLRKLRRTSLWQTAC
jgi:hypothetical protein